MAYGYAMDYQYSLIIDMGLDVNRHGHGGNEMKGVLKLVLYC